jgi:hypothetical protein
LIKSLETRPLARSAKQFALLNTPYALQRIRGNAGGGKGPWFTAMAPTSSAFYRSCRTHKSMERLMTAYQEDLLSLDELRNRMPELRQREQAMHAELQSIVTHVKERAAQLRLAETLSAFLSRLRASAETLDVLERQRVVRLLVKEIVVGDDAITIRHAIPLPPSTRDDGPSKSGGPGKLNDKSYLLRSGRHRSALRNAAAGICSGRRSSLSPSTIIFFHRGLKPHLDQMQHMPI